LKCVFFITIIRSDNLMSEIFRMNTILWDGESVFPEKVKLFKKFLKDYLSSLDNAELLEGKQFHYDPEDDEFLNSDIQEYYRLWSIA
ncbi:MAG: hypothetical protein L0G61_06000, partial [Staphylococcus equorum]|nr:hypothetical protein [Staphylococcus equorum]